MLLSTTDGRVLATEDDRAIAPTRDFPETYSFDFTSMDDGDIPDGLTALNLPGQSPVGIEDGRLRPLGTSVATSVPLLSALIKRSTVLVECPRIDGFQVAVTFDTDTRSKAVHQVGPCVGNGPWQRPTFSFWSDYTFGLGHYLNTAAAPPVEDYGDPIVDDPYLGTKPSSYNQILIDTAGHPFALPDAGTPYLVDDSLLALTNASPITMVIRCVGLQMDCWWNGTKMLDAFTYRTTPVRHYERFGVDMLHIKVTDLDPGFEFLDPLIDIPEGEIGVRALSVGPVVSLSDPLTLP